MRTTSAHRNLRLSMSVMAFHEKAGRSQVGSFVFSLDIVFLSRRVATVAMLPSALSRSDSFRSVHVGSAAVKPGEDFVEPFAILNGAVMCVVIANACYTLGSVVDMVWYNGDNQPELTSRYFLAWSIVFSWVAAL